MQSCSQRADVVSLPHARRSVNGLGLFGGWFTVRQPYRRWLQLHVPWEGVVNRYAAALAAMMPTYELPAPPRYRAGGSMLRGLPAKPDPRQFSVPGPVAP